MKATIHNSSFFGSLIIIATILVSACTTSNNNWPQFRGPDANMIVSGENLPAEWGEELNVAWACDMEGEGWASPVVWGDQVFVSTVVAEKINKPGEGEEENQDLFRKDQYRWQLSCVDLETGQEIWTKVLRKGSPRIQKHARTNYASETPVTDGEKIYVYNGMTGLYCLDMQGELLWDKDLGAYETARGWGTGSSPLLYDDMLYVQVDNEEQSFLVALNAETGDEKWKVNRDEITGYSTPFIWKNRERTELVTGGIRARSYDPENGELLWELQMDGRRSIPGPVANSELLFLGNVEHRTSPGTFFAVKAGAAGDISPDTISKSSDGLAWYYKDIATGNPSPLLLDGLVYLATTRGGGIICLDAESGEIVYEEKLEGVGACWASPWVHEDRIFLTDEKGVTKVFRAGRDFEYLHENSLDDRFWASVAVAGDAYIFKGDKKLYCIKK